MENMIFKRKIYNQPIEVKSSGYKTHASLDAFCQKFSDRIVHPYLVYTKDLQKGKEEKFFKRFKSKRVVTILQHYFVRNQIKVSIRAKQCCIICQFIQKILFSVLNKERIVETFFNNQSSASGLDWSISDCQELDINLFPYYLHHERTKSEQKKLQI